MLVVPVAVTVLLAATRPCFLREFAARLALEGVPAAVEGGLRKAECGLAADRQWSPRFENISQAQWKASDKSVPGKHDQPGRRSACASRTVDAWTIRFWSPVARLVMRGKWSGSSTSRGWAV